MRAYVTLNFTRLLWICALFFSPHFLVADVLSPELISQLKTGDIILQPLQCAPCSLIEGETQSIYSHVGVIIVNQGNDPVVSDQVNVLEATSPFSKLTPLNEFLSHSERGQNVQIKRLTEWKHLSARQYQKINHKILSSLSRWIHVPYDHAYRLERDGHSETDSLYCSELVMKLLNPFLSQPITPTPMHFTYHREEWEKYFARFGVMIPDGKLGLSPGDLDRSQLFERVPPLDITVSSQIQTK